MTPPEGDASRPALRFVGLSSITLLLAAHELVVRQTRVYLAPLAQRSEALLFAALGALACGFVAIRMRRPREGLAWAFLGFAVVCPLSVVLFDWALSAPHAWRLVRFALPTLGGALCAASAVCLVRSVGTAWSELGLVRGLLGPARVLFAVAALIAGLTLGSVLGLLRYGFVLGVLSAFVAFRADSISAYLWSSLPRRAHLRTALALALAASSAGLLHQADRLIPRATVEAHDATLVYARGAGRERLELTSAQGAFALFVGDSLRWSGLDGARYADALVTPAATLSGAPKRCLVLSGGDGLVARRLLDVPGVRHVTLVTSELAVWRETARLVPLLPWTRGRSSDDRIEVIGAEPLPWLDARTTEQEPFDLILVDLPDPTDTVTAKNYTQYFYERLRARLATQGVVAVQAAPLLRAPHVFRNVAATLEHAGFVLRPYEAELPALGLWGFLLAVRPDHARVELTGTTRRAPWPRLPPSLPLRPLATDTPFGGLEHEVPSRLNELRVLHLASAAPPGAEADDPIASPESTL